MLAKNCFGNKKHMLTLKGRTKCDLHQLRSDGNKGTVYKQILRSKMDNKGKCTRNTCTHVHKIG